MNDKFSVVELFAGAGGMALGMELAGLNHSLLVEIDKNCVETLKHNKPHWKVEHKDISEVDFKNVKAEIVTGGFPCQAFSYAGKKLGFEDTRGTLFFEFARCIKEVQPKIFVGENVEGLLTHDSGKTFKTMISILEDLGYNIKYKVLNAVNYGVAQKRKRLIIVGTKLKAKFNYPEPTHYNPEEGQTLLTQELKTYLTLAEAISDLPFIKSSEESFEYSTEPANEFQKLMRKNAPKKLMDHNAPNNNENLVKIMENLPDGGTPNDLPEELRPKSGFANTYCRLWWNRPSTTITRNLSTPSSSRCIHPKAPRPLTTREGARIQCFPDDYVFYGSRSDRNLQIGNAVPTFLSGALKNSIKKHLIK